MLTNKTRTYGIEIEFTHNGNSNAAISAALNAAGVYTKYAGYTHMVTDFWKIVTDASVSGGYELVSPILKGDAGIAELEKVCDVLAALGCGVNKSCGLHVHHDIRSLNEPSVLNLFKSFAKSEAAIDGMMPASRRGNGARHVRTLKNKGIGAATSMNDLRRRLGTRYLKLNFESYWRQGTVEFRHHSGTIDFEKISNWIFITQRMVEKSIEGEFGSRDFATMINNLFAGASAAASSAGRFGLRGINKLCREYFEAGETDNDVIYAALMAAYPDCNAVPHRVANNRKKWLKSLNSGSASSSMNAVIEYANNRYAHFNPAMANAA